MSGILTLDDISLFWASFKVAPIGTLMDTVVLVVELMTKLPEVLHLLFHVFVDVYLHLLVGAHRYVQRCRPILMAVWWQYYCICIFVDKFTDQNKCVCSCIYLLHHVFRRTLSNHFV